METVGAPPSENGTRPVIPKLNRITTQELRAYNLPTSTLTKTLKGKDVGRVPLVLCACGSFSPITYRKAHVLSKAGQLLTTHSTSANVRGSSHSRLKAMAAIGDSQSLQMARDWARLNTEYTVVGGC